MSQPYAVPLNTEWSQVSFDHEFLTVLRARDMEPQIEELYSVGTIRHGSDDSSGYVLAVVSHLPAPLDTVDVADTERLETVICGCPGWFNHCYDEEVGAKIDDCKHCKQVSKQRRTEIADNQEQLI